MLIKISFVLLFSYICLAADLPTNYQYYTAGGIHSGLVAQGDKFHLNGKEIQIFAGCLHPFRVLESRWSDTLEKMKAAGLNAVEFYTAWNLHELTPGHFDFESGTQNLKRFLTLIKEHDMFAVFRPGPYICAEWELGGYPSWLLKDPNMRFRTNYKPYLDAIDRYFSKLFAIAKDFQFSVNGGPIIMIQIENEYGNSLSTDKNRGEYIRSLINMSHKYGMKELLFKGDWGPDKTGLLDDVLQTINYGAGEGAPNRLNSLKKLQPNKPLYVYEYYSGQADSWTNPHHTRTVQQYANTLQDTLKMGASFGMYMFFGGTNFGWMAGGDGKTAQTTSYDFDAPLTESGDYTPKYYKTIEMLEKHVKDHKLPQIRRPNPPAFEKAANYGVVKLTEQISLNDLVKHVDPHKVDKPIHPEYLNIGPNYGQLFGFTLYRTTIPKSKTLHFQNGQVRDRVNLLVDGKQSGDVLVQGFGPTGKGFSLNLDQTAFTKSGNDHTLDILTENMGRFKFDLEGQRKGLYEDVLIDGKVQHNWEMYPLDFKQDFLDKVKKDKWSPISGFKEPTLYRTKFEIKDQPKDTYIKMDGWHTTVVFINDFNIGKFWSRGPQKHLFIPGQLLKKGENEILLFETTGNGNQVELVDHPNLG